MVKTTIDSDVVTTSSSADVPSEKPETPGSKGPVTSADQINGWTNSEIIIRETDIYLAELLRNIQSGRRVNLKGRLG